MRLSTAHDYQGEHGAAVEDPSAEREEVDQRVYRPVQYHRDRDQRLQENLLLI